MNAIRLKTEHLINPIGTNFSTPTLSWNCEGGEKQTSYQVIATTENGEVLLDSGKINSSSMHCCWNAEPIKPKTKVLWKVRLWDEQDKVGDFSYASFENGISCWKAKWITGNYSPNPRNRYPVDCFKKIFTANKITKARLYISACGLYEAKINSKKCGDFILAPGITDYRLRVQAQTYDVTDLLMDGENILEISLADGWYRGSCGAWGRKNQYGKQTKVIAQLELTKEDGTTEFVCSDKTFSWSNDGPIRFADNKDGEIVEAKLIPSYSGFAKETKHSVFPVASNNVPVTKHERFSAKIIKTPSGKTILDFGQNISGYVEFDLNAKEGQNIKLLFGEYIDKSGEFTQKNIQCSTKHYTTPLQKVEYTCKEGRNHYKTTFAIFGFRYVLVESDLPINEKDFTAIAVYSDLEETSEFSCSNKLINKFYQNTIWSAKGNSCDLPTDCPTRERHGWSGDAQIFCSTACYLFDYAPFALKYLNDLYDWQRKNGCLPQIAPDGGTDFYMRAMDGSVGWADAGIIIPYILWKQYGDKKVLEKYLSGMEKYAKFQMNRCGKWYPTAKNTGLQRKDKKYINNAGQSYGEWAEPDDVHHMTWKDCAVPHPDVATAYNAYVLSLLAEIEDTLGNKEKAKTYLEFSNNCKKSYSALVETKQFSLDTDRQAHLVRSLAFDLLNNEQKSYAKDRLIKALNNYNWRIGTGFLSTPLILDVLKEIDIKYAYRLLENEQMPGWLFMPKNNATTIWEAWEGTESKNGGIGSLNHYSKGAVCRFLFETVCGIKITGENEFTISPLIGGTLTNAKASYTSVYGKVTSMWEKKYEKIIYTVTVPSGCVAKVTLPNGKTSTQNAGTKIYEE